MKTTIQILAGAFLLATAPPDASAGGELSINFFHENLGSYGDWREVGDYGYVWQPRDVDPDWRPYRDGRWLYTDAGWTWDSDEPYSWAVYHYGRWARVNGIGWVWAPGTEWGPAWVSWRRSPQHVGWAPLPPEARFTRSVGFGSRVDYDYDIGPGNYNFVGIRDFGSQRLGRVIVNPRENLTIIRNTTNITRISYTNNYVYNEGPRYDVAARESAEPIRRLKLVKREDFDPDSRKDNAQQFRTAVDGDSYRVAAPKFDGKAAKAPAKIAERVAKADVNRGWSNVGPAKEVEKQRTRIASERNQPAPKLPPIPKTANDEPAKPIARVIPETKPKAVKPTAPKEKPPVIAEPPKIRPAAPVKKAPEPKPENPRTSRPSAPPTERNVPEKIQPGRGEAHPKQQRPPAPDTIRPKPADISKRPAPTKPDPAEPSKTKDGKKPGKKKGETSEIAPE